MLQSSQTNLEQCVLGEGLQAREGCARMPFLIPLMKNDEEEGRERERDTHTRRDETHKSRSQQEKFTKQEQGQEGGQLDVDEQDEEEHNEE